MGNSPTVCGVQKKGTPTNLYLSRDANMTMASQKKRIKVALHMSAIDNKLTKKDTVIVLFSLPALKEQTTKKAIISFMVGFGGWCKACSQC